MGKPIRRKSNKEGRGTLPNLKHETALPITRGGLTAGRNHSSERADSLHVLLGKLDAGDDRRDGEALSRRDVGPQVAQEVRGQRLPQERLRQELQLQQGPGVALQQDGGGVDRQREGGLQRRL